MHETSIAVSQNPQPLIQSSTHRGRRWRSLAVLLTLFVAALIHAHTAHAAPGTPADTPASRDTSEYRGEPGAETDELDGEDDGSQALNDGSRSIDVEMLHPVDLDEEQTLLGDWGDSENED